MRAFLIQHIDALICTGIGLWMTAYCWRHRERLRTNPKKTVRALPTLSAAVLVFGLLRLTFDSHPVYAWQRASTDDGQASAEFPCPVTRESAIDSAGGVSLKRLTVKCNVPQRDINLRLSFNEIPPEGAGLSVEQRADGLKSFLQQQGFTIVSITSEAHGNRPGLRIVAESEAGKIRCLMRAAIAPTAIYRAVVTSSSGFHDDPVISRFVDSFALR